MTIYLNFRPQSHTGAQALMEMFKCESFSGTSGTCETGGGSSMANNRTGSNPIATVREFLDDTLQLGLNSDDKITVMAHSNIGGSSDTNNAQKLVEEYPNTINFVGNTAITKTTSAPFVAAFIVIAKESTFTSAEASGVWIKKMATD